MPKHFSRFAAFYGTLARIFRCAYSVSLDGDEHYTLCFLCTVRGTCTLLDFYFTCHACMRSVIGPIISGCNSVALIAFVNAHSLYAAWALHWSAIVSGDLHRPSSIWAVRLAHGSLNLSVAVLSANIEVLLEVAPASMPDGRQRIAASTTASRPLARMAHSTSCRSDAHTLSAGMVVRGVCARSPCFSERKTHSGAL